MYPSEKRHADLIESLKESCGEPTEYRFRTIFSNCTILVKPSTTIDALKAAIDDLAISEGEREPMMVDDVLAMLRDMLARAEEDRAFMRQSYVKAAHGELREAVDDTARRWDVDSDVVIEHF